MNTFEYNANRQISQLHDRIKKLEEEILTVRIAEAEQRRCAEEALAKLSHYESAVEIKACYCSCCGKLAAGLSSWFDCRDSKSVRVIVLKEDV